MQLREFGRESPAKKALFSSVRDNNNDPASIIPAVICQLLVTNVSCRRQDKLTVS